MSRWESPERDWPEISVRGFVGEVVTAVLIVAALVVLVALTIAMGTPA